MNDIARATRGGRGSRQRGLPDIAGFTTRGQAFFLELKTPNGKVTPEQIIWLEHAEANGCISAVIRSLDDILPLFERCLLYSD